MPLLTGRPSLKTERRWVMKTSRMLGLLGAALVGLTTARCNCGGHEECLFSPGTPVADVPVIEGRASPPYYSTPRPYGVVSEGAFLFCCNRWGGEAGVTTNCGIYGIVDCTKVAPAELLSVAAPYSGWECAPDEGWGAPKYECFVWVRDGGIVGACGGCPPD